MDAKHFDSVARAVGQGTARRRLLTGLLGTILAGSLGRATVSAKGKRQHRRRHGAKAEDDTLKPTGKKCNKNAQCQSTCCRAAGDGKRVCQEPDCAGKPCGAADGCGGKCQTQSCPTCQTCVGGTCTAVPNNTKACDGTALIAVGSAFCTNSGGETGICVDGACSCVSQIPDQTGNRCLCSRNPCSGNPPPNQCCHISQICSDPGIVGSGCHACT